MSYDVAFTDPCDRAGARAHRRRLPGARRRRARLPGVRRPHGDRLRPVRADARLAGHADPAGRDAPDLAGRRRHQLRDARDRPPDPRLRRRPPAGTARRTTRCRGGAAAHPRRHRPRAVDRGPRGLRRLRRDRSRWRDGRRDHRDLRGDDHGRGRGGALGPGLDVPHRQAPQAHLRGRQAQRARRRPDHLRGRRRPRRRAADDLRRRHGRAGRHRRRHARPAARRDRALATALAGQVAGLPIDGRTGARRTDRDRCFRSPATTSSRSPRRRGGPTSPTPTTWSRRSSGSSATTRCRRCCRGHRPVAG